MPEDVAGAVAFLLSDKARDITGQTLLINEGSVMAETTTARQYDPTYCTR